MLVIFSFGKQARYLQDHGVPQIPLTWARGMQLYQFYLPDELPEFDSYRVTSITSDVECLLKRIAALVPSQYSPGTNAVHILIECMTVTLEPLTYYITLKHLRNVMLLNLTESHVFPILQDSDMVCNV